MPRTCALLVVACALACAACTHDFEAFEPRGAPHADAGADGDAAGGCPAGGVTTPNGHCYFPTSSSSAWATAKASCEAAGAHLATITDTDEETTVQSIAPGNDRWIGGSRPVGSAIDPHSYQWITGEPMTYLKWAAGEPSGAGECMRLTSSNAWADQNCAVALVAVCERE